MALLFRLYCISVNAYSFVLPWKFCQFIVARDKPTTNANNTFDLIMTRQFRFSTSFIFKIYNLCDFHCNTILEYQISQLPIQVNCKLSCNKLGQILIHSIGNFNRFVRPINTIQYMCDWYTYWVLSVSLTIVHEWTIVI